MKKALPEPPAASLDLSAVLDALADPIRRQLLREIRSTSAPRECGYFARRVDLSPATLSYHWRILREAGLTSTVVDGRERYVSLRVDDLDRRFPGLIRAVLDTVEPGGGPPG